MKLDEPFGIIVLNDNSLGRIGTKVKVESVTKNYPDGSFDIIVRGEERFILKTVQENIIGYFEAEVDQYSDLITGIYSELEGVVLNLFNEVIEKAGVKLEDNFYINLEETRNKSFKLADRKSTRLNSSH